jgi:hypothetical protein
MAALHLEIPRELKSPNKWQGRHWRYKHRETQQWEWEIAAVALTTNGGYLQFQRDGGMLRPYEVRRVTVTRIVPSKRNFIKDDDNLRFSTKPLNDALKRLGLIYDDSRKWLQQPIPEQIVSPEGEWRTVIEIAPVEGNQGGV